MDNSNELPTSSTTAWTTLRVDHMSTAPAAVKELYIFNDLRPKSLRQKGGPRLA